MAALIKQIEIGNFKSIRNAKIHSCKRINLFIGRPNVGKSNILEALSLFSVPYLAFYKSKNLKDFVRGESAGELFYSGDFESPAYVETNIALASLMLDRVDGLDLKLFFEDKSILEHFYFSDNLQLVNRRKRALINSPVKKYTFNTRFEDSDLSNYALLPPFGGNLYRAIETHEELRKEVEGIFKEYQLELVFDRASRTLKVLKHNKDSVFLIPYNSIADTLQRIIFYKAAIASNDNSVLLFEEPEAHSFPPYITQVTQEMIYHKTNQYFVATHSPFILNDLMENARDELAVYLIDYKQQETKVKRLSDQSMHEIYQSGVDLFTNWETFA
jgi:AAA15 family ATPase/GTPase